MRAFILLVIPFAAAACLSCCNRSQHTISEEPSVTRSLVAEWVEPTLAGRRLPGVLTLDPTGTFTFRVAEVAIADGPAGSTYTPYEIVVTGSFKAQQNALVLTPRDIAGPEHYRVAATRLMGLEAVGVPAAFAFETIANNLRLTKHDGLLITFVRRATKRGV